MPCYLFTYHAYRSWNANHPRGFVLEAGRIEPPSLHQANFYDSQAKQPRVLFRPVHQRILLWIIQDACARRKWRLHAVATNPTHIHVLMSWRSEERWQEISRRLKVLSSLMLGRKSGIAGRKWFVRRSSRKRIRNREHFDYLVTTYLPRHRGLLWKEGDALPQEPPPRQTR
jgi:REP element-mobilizing transposase RayT